MRVEALGLPITLDLENARALLIGDDDEERARKQLLLDDAGAQLVVLAPAQFDDDALDGARLVMVTARDAALAARVSAAARARRVLVWCSDDPARSDFAMPAIARLGRARIATSTAGSAPALARRIRLQLEAALDTPELARFVAALGTLRETLQRDQPDFEARREALTRAVADFELTIAVRYPDWLKASSR